MYIDQVQSGAVLKVVSTLATGLFAGGSFYVTVVENPARMTHDSTSAITMWKPSFLRAKFIQSKLVMLSSFTSIGVYGCLRNQSSSEAYHWLGAGCAMLTLWPLTMIFIMPINNQLLETEKCISTKGDRWIVDTLNQWSKLHNIRTIISLGAFSFMIYTLSKS